MQVYNPIPWAKFRNQRYAGGRVLVHTSARHVVRWGQLPAAAAWCLPASLPSATQTWTALRFAGDFADEGEEIQIYHYKRCEGGRAGGRAGKRVGL